MAEDLRAGLAIYPRQYQFSFDAFSKRSFDGAAAGGWLAVDDPLAVCVSLAVSFCRCLNVFLFCLFFPPRFLVAEPAPRIIYPETNELSTVLQLPPVEAARQVGCCRCVGGVGGVVVFW